MSYTLDTRDMHEPVLRMKTLHLCWKCWCAVAYGIQKSAHYEWPSPGNAKASPLPCEICGSTRMDERLY